ncbi:Calx-beta domain-containing protein [Kaarinaea lacus]
MLVVTNAHALSFAPQVSYELSETSPADVVAADFNNDGNGDLAVTMSGADGGVGGISILLGDGAGAFPSHNQVAATGVDGLGYSPWGIAAADFNGDGNQDLVVTAYGSGVYKVNIYLGDGTGLFTASSVLVTSSQSPATVVTGLFNNDAFFDIAVGSDSGSGAAMSVFFGVGDGTFGGANPITASTSLSVKDIVTADFDLDGSVDLITTRQVLLNDGNGNFSNAGSTGGNTAVGVSTFDANRDGWTDVIVANSTSIDILLNDQNGMLLYSDNYSLVSSKITAIASVDFDNDGDPDFVVSDENSDQIYVYTGLGDGSFSLPESFATGVEPKTVAAAEWSGDNAADIAVPYRNGGETPYASVLIQQAGGSTPPAGSFQFSSATYSIAENGASLTVTVSRVAGNAGAVSVDYASADGTATSGNDYSAVSGTLNFANGVTSQTIIIPILDDSNYEGNENFTISLSLATGGATIAAPATTTVTIIENDPAPQPGSLQFSVASYFVAENGVNANITVTRTGGSSGLVSVDYATSDSGATATADYTPTNGTLNFADGVVSQSFSVPILDDVIYEGNETFTVSLSNVTGGAVLGATTTTTVTITENDPIPPAGILQFNAATYSIGEAGGSLTVTVTRSNGSYGTVTVGYSTMDGSATASNDYSPVGGLLTFADGVTSQTITVPILEDTLYESNELFSIQLSGVTGGASLGAHSSATITITDNDPVPPAGTLQFSGVNFNVQENGVNITITVTRTGGSFGTVTVDYLSNDGSATAGSDYTAVNDTLVLPDGVTSETNTISIQDDSVYEGNENFSVSLSNVTGGATLGVNSSTTITINDNEPVPPAGILQFSGVTYNIAENVASVTTTVTRTSGSFGTVTVNYNTVDGTATANGDYSPVSGILTFADGVTSQTITIPILNDMVYEVSEQFGVQLSGVTGGASLGGIANTTITIIDDDPVPPAGTLQFSGANFSVAENGSSINITVTRSGGSFGAVTVDYATSDSSATAGNDYTAAVGTLTFADGEVSLTITLTILDDSVYEGDENFGIGLSNVTGGASLGSINNAAITIVENESVPPAGSLHFGMANYSVIENAGNALITVVRTGGSFGEVTVNYVTGDGTASAGSDYSATSGMLTFPDGVTTQTITVPIVDDATFEGNETVLVSLSSVTGGVNLGTPATATITILENDPVPPAGSLQFSGASYSVSENNGTVVVTVTRAGGSFGQVSVDFATSDGSATMGNDYTAQSGTLTFADGETSQTIIVPITDDSVFEGNENFSINLNSVTGGASISTPSNAVINILENDPVPAAGILQFSGSAYSVAEDGTSLLITVTRVGGSFGSVTVDYETSDGTATAGSDFSAISGTLTFANGVTSQEINIPILDDMLFENDETFTLRLFNVGAGAVLGALSTTTVTIVDDNDPQSPSTTPSPPSQHPSSGSGGGSISLLFLLFLTTLCVYRRERFSLKVV